MDAQNITRCVDVCLYLSHIVPHPYGFGQQMVPVCGVMRRLLPWSVIGRDKATIFFLSSRTDVVPNSKVVDSELLYFDYGSSGKENAFFLTSLFFSAFLRRFVSRFLFLRRRRRRQFPFLAYTGMHEDACRLRLSNVAGPPQQSTASCTDRSSKVLV